MPFDQFFKLTQHNSTRGHSLKVFYPDSRINARAHFFSVRVILLWNRQPAALAGSRTIICLRLSLCFELLIFHILYWGSYSLFLGFYVSFYLFIFLAAHKW